MRRICLQWPRFGPYHLARLEAVHALLGPQGVEVIGLETAGRDVLYGWRSDDAAASFRREQVFPGRVFEELRPAEIHAGMIGALDRLRPDAVVLNSYGYPDARAGLWWCRRHRRVAVVVTDSKEDDAPRVWWRERIKSSLVRQFDAALLGGTPHQAYFEKLGFPRDYIYLGCDVVDNDYFHREAECVRARPEQARHLPGLEPDTPFFLAVGRLLPVKNMGGLLEAYRRYRAAAAAPWRLVIVGEGPERAEIEATVAQHDLRDVTLAGFQGIDVLPAYYGRAGALVLPSRKDTWGLVVNEAMAAGLPVLVSERAGCAPDLVRDGENGYRFDPADPAALARLMARVAEAPVAERAAMGRRSREIIAEWPLERFATNVWAAVQAGHERADRIFPPHMRLFLSLLPRLARKVDSFSTVEV